MDVRKCSILPPSASKKALHRFSTVSAVARVICKVSLHWYLSLLSWNQPWMQAWPFKLRVWPSSIGKRHRGCNQGNAKAKRPPTITRWFSIELIQDGLGAVSICAILLPDVDLTNDRWLDQIMTRSWAGHQRYRWHQSWTACFIHYPFHYQPFSIHEPNKLKSSLCYTPASDMPACL